MASKAAVVEAWLRGENPLRTRLRERASGDAHDLLFPPPLAAVALRQDDLITSLEALEKEGLVVRSEAVHVYDSSEYTVTWRMARMCTQNPA
jgi:hypothetical protein